MKRGHGARLPALLLLGSMALSACSQDTRQRVLTTFFEGVPKPGEPSVTRPLNRSPRHPRLPPPRPPVIEVSMPNPEVEQAPGPRTWPEALRTLPNDAAGGVDWIRALEAQAIRPKAGLDPEAKDQAIFDLDVELTPEAQPIFKVTFPHKAHTAWLACANCHPGIFQMQAGADPITMGKIFAGEFCGRCHGKVSFAVPTGCPRCHPALAGGK
jgi:c(7)-type cytochrome triheme protein